MNLSWLWVLLALVVVAAIFGFGGVFAAAAEVVKIIFWVLLIAFIIGLVFGFTRGRRTAL